MSDTLTPVEFFGGYKQVPDAGWFKNALDYLDQATRPAHEPPGVLRERAADLRDDYYSCKHDVGVDFLEAGCDRSLDEGPGVLLRVRWHGGKGLTGDVPIERTYIDVDKDTAMALLSSLDARSRELSPAPDDDVLGGYELDAIRAVLPALQRIAATAGGGGAPLPRGAATGAPSAPPCDEPTACTCPEGPPCDRPPAQGALDTAIAALSKVLNGHPDDLVKAAQRVVETHAAVEAWTYRQRLLDRYRWLHEDAWAEAVGAGVIAAVELDEHGPGLYGIRVDLGDDWYALITPADDASLDPDRDVEQWTVGIYAPDQDSTNALYVRVDGGQIAMAEQIEPLFTRLGLRWHTTRTQGENQ